MWFTPSQRIERLHSHVDPIEANAQDRLGVIDAVFLTSNSREQALECVAHLRDPEIASVVVVDNASSDGTVEAIRNAHPDVTVLALDASTGLAAGMNRGAELGGAPFILYLNDDVFAAPGSISLLLEALQGRDDAVAAGGRLVDPDLTTQNRYRPRKFPSPVTIVARLLGLERLWHLNPWTGDHLRRKLDDHTTVAVDQPAGACMLVRRSVAERVGGWDERYWFWYEDVDFSRRLAAHGTQLYVPTAPFRHVGGATARRLRRSEGHGRTFHGVLVYTATHFSAPGRACVALTLLAISVARVLRTVGADREAARVYGTVARGAVALLMGRGVGHGRVFPSIPAVNGLSCDGDFLADRYLELLKGALSHTLYAEVDGGINYRRNVLGRALFAMMRCRNVVPVRIGPQAARDRLQGNDWPVFAQTMVGRARLDNLHQCVDDVIREQVPGDLIETGVWRGGSSILMRGILQVRGITDRVVWACDSFEGLPPSSPQFPADNRAIWHRWKPLSVNLEEVTANFARYGLLDDQVRLVKGWFKNTLPELHDRHWAVIRLDGDMYESTIDALTHLYPNLSPGGYMIVDDYWGVEACRMAVHDYRDAHGIREPIKTVDWTGAYWRREALGG